MKKFLMFMGNCLLIGLHQKTYGGILLRKILNELDEPESVKKEIYAQIQKDIT